VDSIHCHSNWAKSLGGISFPLVADFHPKGEMGNSYGAYLSEKGLTDRATVIIDAGGIVQYAASVGTSGERDIDALLEEAQKNNSAYSGNTSTVSQLNKYNKGGTLFVRNSCGFSRSVMAAIENLHIDDAALQIRNVSVDSDAMAELKKLTGKEQAPCLYSQEEAQFESTEIIKTLVTQCTGFWS